MRLSRARYAGICPALKEHRKLGARTQRILHARQKPIGRPTVGGGILRIRRRRARERRRRAVSCSNNSINAGAPARYRNGGGGTCSSFRRGEGHKGARPARQI